MISRHNTTSEHPALCHQHASTLKILIIAILITGLFAIIEAVTGWLANSLTLMGDAGHMFADTLSLMIAAGAAWVATRPPSQHKTYGFGRIEVLAAFISGLLLLGIVAGIVLEAIEHLRIPEAVDGKMVIIIGTIGLAANMIVAWTLHHDEKNLNVKAAFLHVISDLLGSIAAVIAGTVIYFSGWMPIDPILSLFISLLILRSTFKLLRKTLNILMEGTPEGIDIPNVCLSICKLPHVKSIHDFHIWTLTSEKLLLSAHVVIDDLDNWPLVLESIRKRLRNDYHIEHITLQPETEKFSAKTHKTESCGCGML